MSPAPPSTPTHASKSQRILACVLCQQRKIKCDRTFPCAQCIKSQVRCVPGSQVQRQRKRRFPERALLDRLRRYEDLLRQNKIAFQPLHDGLDGGNDSARYGGVHHSEDEHEVGTVTSASAASPTQEPARPHEAKNVWHVMSQGYRDPDYDSDSSHDGVRENTVKQAWEQAHTSSKHLLFNSRKTNLELATLHPDPVQIFRLWQIYLDNVDPLLKVTHAPTLQGRVIQAAGNIANVDRNLGALMFAIYCTSIMSLQDDECQNIFGSARDDLLNKYQLACQEALLHCDFLKTTDRECLTALYLYLISTRSSLVPYSLSSLLAIAVRVAQRMGMNNESTLNKFTIFEAEMCRRLWWSLVMFDARIAELSRITTGSLDPTWDCQVPLNVNDSDLRPEMKEMPPAQGRTTESLFAVVRGELGDFVRHSSFHLDFTNPALKPIAKHSHNSSTAEINDFERFEDSIEDKYLKFCDAENRMHYMTIWSARTYVAKCRFLAHCSRFSDSSASQLDSQRDIATAHALKMLECDTMLRSSPLTKGFLWMSQMYFPLPAHMQICQDLKRRPNSTQAQRAWSVMSANYSVWLSEIFRAHSPFFHIFARIVIQAWEACQASFESSGLDTTTPSMVTSIREKQAQKVVEAQTMNQEQLNNVMDVGGDNVLIQNTTFPDFENQMLSYNLGSTTDFAMSSPGVFPTIWNPSPLYPRLNPMDFTMMGGWPSWGQR